MERINDIKEYIKGYCEERKERRKKNIDFIIEQSLPSFQDKLNILTAKQIQRQREEKEDKVKFVFLCSLMSSVYTESNACILGMSNSLLYLDQKQSQVYWQPEFFSDSIEEDMHKAKQQLRKKFVRLEEFELFTVKKSMFQDDWEVFEECFRLMSKVSFHLLKNSPLHIEDEFMFLAGNYMDKLRVISYINERG